MDELKMLCEKIKKELETIAEKGITTSNIDNAYKLVDMYKDLKEVAEMEMESEGGYSEKRDSRGRYSRDGGSYYGEPYHDGTSHRGGNSYEYGNSYARQDEHHVRGRYSRAGGSEDSFNRYMESKRDYRYSQSAECKQRLMDTLNEYMDDFTAQMEEMLRDSDCQEERATIKRYIDKLKNLK